MSVSKRLVSVFLAWALLVLLPVAAAVAGIEPVAGAAIDDSDQVGHAVDINDDGDIAMAVVKDSGRLYTRERIDGRWSGWTIQGRDNWVSADITIDGFGFVSLIGVKDTGHLYTRTKDTFRHVNWGRWTLHGAPTWSTSSVPSIDSGLLQKSVLAAVKENGALYTRENDRFDGPSWEGWQRHGANNWAHADIEMDRGGAVLAGTKLDGRLFTRAVLSPNGPWQEHGAPTWSTDTAPAISLAFDEVTLGAVKADGRALVRTGVMVRSGSSFTGRWDNFGAPIDDDAAGIDVASSPDHIAIGLTGRTGVLAHTSMNQSTTGWSLQEEPTFLSVTGGSASVAPNVATAEGSFNTDIDVFLGVHTNGSLALWEQHGSVSGTGFRQLTSPGSPTWAAGPRSNLVPVNPPTYPPGLYTVGPTGLPAGTYDINKSPAEFPGCLWYRFSTIDQDGFLENLVDGVLDVEADNVLLEILPSDGAVWFMNEAGTGCDSLSPSRG